MAEKPEQQARGEIDRQFAVSGWSMQSIAHGNAHAPRGAGISEVPRDCYWLYVVTHHGDTAPRLETPVQDPARTSWHPVIKVQHYWLEVDAMAQPMAIEQPVVRYQVKSDDDA